MRLNRIIPIALGVAALLVAVALLLVPRTETTSATQGPETVLQGSLLKAQPAPGFRLTDQWDKTVTLASLRGHPVLITFLSSICTTNCPLVAEDIHQALDRLGAAGRDVDVVAISTDPEGDTPASIVKFSNQHHLLHRWLFLTGSRDVLTPVWLHYYVFAAPANAPAAIKDSHTSGTYLIDRQGRWRVLLTGALNVNTLTRDLLVLSGRAPSLLLPRGSPAPEVGHPAPDFALRTPAGRTMALSGLRGQTVLVNFWASWCIPCRSEAPRLAQWYNRLRGQGFVALGVDQQEGAGDVSDFVRHFHLTYPIVLDSDATVTGRYNVAVLPVSFLVNAQGTVTAVQYGGVEDGWVKAHVLPLLAASPA
jgi:protein SCO1/2